MEYRRFSTQPSHHIGFCHTWSGKLFLPLLLLCLIVIPSRQVLAQGEFSLSVKGLQKMGKNATLTIYDGDSTFRRQQKRIKGDELTFNGHLRQACAAELSFGGGNSLYLYLEAAEMSLDIKADDFDHSPLSGSRSNSQYRYAMENGADAKLIADYLRSNNTSPIAAFVLFRQMRNLELVEVKRLYNLLDSSEARCYHYFAINRYLSESEMLAEGNPLPDFEFVEEGQKCRLSECLVEGRASVVLFGASWCDICQRDSITAEKICADSITLINVSIDADRRGWDAPYLKKLDIAHLPYIILLDKDGNIAARDVRIWELKRQLAALKKH